MTLYLKYRPKIIDELDLESVRVSLGKIVKSGKIPHALLFSGPKGTGKTSAARILAKIINCEQRRKNSVEPCNKCSQCKSITNSSSMDVIELDAASHRGIDDIRTLREAVKLAPSSAKKKVYIIDESHMLTLEASNALLKTLEEPPDHVVFILATTNPEKLLPTIRSRTTNIKFEKASKKELARSLERVCRGEKIKYDEDGLLKISENADGSFRDAIKIVEQLSLEGYSAKKGDVEKYFKKSQGQLRRLLDSIFEKDEKKAIEIVRNITKEGMSANDLQTELLKSFREILLSNVGIYKGEKKESDFNIDSKDLILLMEYFGRAREIFKDSFIDTLSMEIAIIKWCQRKNTQEAHLDLEEKTDDMPIDTQDLKIEIKKTAADRPKKKEKKSEKQKINKEALKELSNDVWGKILSAVRPINSSIEALLRASKPLGFDGKNLEVGVYYKFHKERLDEAKYKRVLEDIMADVLGCPIRMVCTLSDIPPKKIQKEVVLTENKDEDIIDVAEKIFSN